VQGHTGRTALPEADAAYWQDKAPTQRYAPFDVYTSTAATASTSLTYVLTPGYFNAVAMYGLAGTSYTITLKDATGGTVLYTQTGDLSEPPIGWYEYLFGTLKPLSKLIITDLPIRPTSELTITLTGATVSVGMIVCGDLTSLAGAGLWGGILDGASAEPISYSYINTNTDGTLNIVHRYAATNLRASVVMPRAEADSVLASVQGVLDVPVAWIASTVTGYAGLSTFGLGSGSITYDSFGTATLSINVKGII
jgi:hypothetical protein